MSTRLAYTRVIAKTASFAVGLAYGHAPGTHFTNRGAGGSITATLDAPGLGNIGHWYVFSVYADQSLIVAAAAVNTLVAPGDIAADNVGFQTAGKKVGRKLMVWCDGTSWFATPLAADGFNVDGVESVLTFASGVTLAAPIITAPSGPSSTGLMITKSSRFVEAAAATSYTATVAVPAGAVIHDIQVIAEALWNGTSASGKVGDSVDDDGFFTAIDLKATDLEVGEILSIKESGLWGGTEGAYLVAATGRRGPVATNFGLYYAAGSNIKMIVTPGAADGTLGRTVFSVTYSVGEALAPVVV